MKNRVFYMIISVCVVGGFVALCFYFFSPKKSESNFFGVTMAGNSSAGVDNGAEQTSNSISSEISTNVPKHTYTNTIYKFSVEVPQDVNPSEFDDANGENSGHTILIKNKTFGMQVYVTLFDEDIALTKERIQKDVPDLQMENPTTVSIGGVTAVAFTTTDGGEKYRQVWFVHKRHLYQTLSLVSEDIMMSNILQSWKWF